MYFSYVTLPCRSLCINQISKKRKDRNMIIYVKFSTIFVSRPLCNVLHFRRWMGISHDLQSRHLLDHITSFYPRSISHNLLLYKIRYNFHNYLKIGGILFSWLMIHFFDSLHWSWVASGIDNFMGISEIRHARHFFRHVLVVLLILSHLCCMETSEPKWVNPNDI